MLQASANFTISFLVRVEEIIKLSHLKELMSTFQVHIPRTPSAIACKNRSFLGATKQLCNWLCPSVGLSVGRVTHSFNDPHVAPYWPTWPCFPIVYNYGKKKRTVTSFAYNRMCK